jgi:hypothetical protein
MPLLTSVIQLLALSVTFCAEDRFCCNNVNCVLAVQYGDQ